MHVSHGFVFHAWLYVCAADYGYVHMVVEKELGVVGCGSGSIVHME